MPLWKSYHIPRTVDEALATLAQYGGAARIVAGGTDLMVDLQYTDHVQPLEALVDVTRVQEMLDIHQEADDSCRLGAAVTHATIVKSTLLEARATCLVESCGVVGGPQVRNVGTLGGNVAHALPAGDGTTSLMALDAQALVAWGGGLHEWLPLPALFRGPGVSALDHGKDLLVAFRFTLCAPGEATAFKRIMRPQGVALPILGCAVWVKLNAARTHYDDVRVCVSPVAPKPVRAVEVEAALRGQPVGQQTLENAVAAAHRTLHPRASAYRATAEYRQHMIETLLRQTLPLATERAKTGEARAEGVGLG
ncbi:MAG: FAD binding domain-containing protein [Chloroflexi bacterium]|nr:FAD binding domain-containing protein [Chloroflexota bacterium]